MPTFHPFRPEMVEQVAGSLSIECIASSPVEAFPQDRPVLDVWRQVRPSAEDLDHVLVLSPDSDAPLVAKRSEEWESSKLTIGDVATPVPAEWIVTSDCTLYSGLRKLRDVDCLLLLGDKGEAGIVTPADVHKPHAQLMVLAAVLAFESALSRLLPSLIDRDWKKWLGDQAWAKVEEEADRRRGRDNFLTVEDCLSLSNKLNVARKTVAGQLGYSGSKWDKLTSKIPELRNSIAHVRESTSSGLFGKGLIEQLATIEELTRSLWSLVDERPGVWDKYVATECFAETCEGIMPISAVRQQLPNPVWMVSAQNPCEMILTATKNQSRHSELVTELTRSGEFLAEGLGQSPNGGSWKESMAVAQFEGRKRACQVSRQFGQRSVFEFVDGRMLVVDVETGEVRCERDLD